MAILDTGQRSADDELLVSADSHVAITHSQVRAHLASGFHEDYDDGRRGICAEDGAWHGEPPTKRA